MPDDFILIVFAYKCMQVRAAVAGGALLLVLHHVLIEFNKGDYHANKRKEDLKAVSVCPAAQVHTAQLQAQHLHVATNERQRVSFF